MFFYFVLQITLLRYPNAAVIVETMDPLKVMYKVTGFINVPDVKHQYTEFRFNVSWALSEEATDNNLYAFSMTQPVCELVIFRTTSGHGGQSVYLLTYFLTYYPNTVGYR